MKTLVLAVLAALLLVTPALGECQAEFSSLWHTLERGESVTFDLSIVDCDFTPKAVLVFGYVAKRRSAPQLRHKDKVDLTYEDALGVRAESDGFIVVDDPLLEYTVTMTNTHRRKQKLRLRVSAMRP